MNTDWWKQVWQSRGVMFAAIIAGEVLVVLLVFHAGVSFGERRVFERLHPPQGGGSGFGFLPHGFIPEGHGAVGTITALRQSNFMLHERDGDVEVVALASSTLVSGDASSSSLQVGEEVIVIGDPNEGAEQVTARLIRIISGAAANH